MEDAYSMLKQNVLKTLSRNWNLYINAWIVYAQFSSLNKEFGSVSTVLQGLSVNCKSIIQALGQFFCVHSDVSGDDIRPKKKIKFVQNNETNQSDRYRNPNKRFVLELIKQMIDEINVTGPGNISSVRKSTTLCNVLSDVDGACKIGTAKNRAGTVCGVIHACVTGRSEI